MTAINVIWFGGCSVDTGKLITQYGKQRGRSGEKRNL